ncbi:hypothetical protein A6R68_15231 [Neotoma lepida]|uniref:Uncharacterized protein n=1 Tax=Neotoma lepida TaxID=56216 RepID=A0A1A6H7E6_NEOLE|nr:hypothetical protein A6R68_15231 [Neotoma lepida]
METYKQREKQDKVQESTKGADEQRPRGWLYSGYVTTGQRSMVVLHQTVCTQVKSQETCEDGLVPLCEKADPIWDLRLTMDPLWPEQRICIHHLCGNEAAQEASNCVRAMKFILANTWECALLGQQTFCWIQSKE